MCRNIRTLYNFEPPATVAEIEASALQYVRKVSGMRSPSKANATAFAKAVLEVQAATAKLFEALTTSAPARDRDQEAERARARRLGSF